MFSTSKQSSQNSNNLSITPHPRSPLLPQGVAPLDGSVKSICGNLKKTVAQRLWPDATRDGQPRRDGGRRPPPAGRQREEPLGSGSAARRLLRAPSRGRGAERGSYGTMPALLKLWVRLPSDFWISGNTNKVCKIRNAVGEIDLRMLTTPFVLHTHANKLKRASLDKGLGLVPK